MRPDMIIPKQYENSERYWVEVYRQDDKFHLLQMAEYPKQPGEPGQRFQPFSLKHRATIALENSVATDVSILHIVSCFAFTDNPYLPTSYFVTTNHVFNTLQNAFNRFRLGVARRQWDFPKEALESIVDYLHIFRFAGTYETVPIRPYSSYTKQVWHKYKFDDETKSKIGKTLVKYADKADEYYEHCSQRIKDWDGCVNHHRDKHRPDAAPPRSQLWSSFFSHESSVSNVCLYCFPEQ